MLLARGLKETEKLKKTLVATVSNEATGDEREFTLIILIYIIYLEEFITSLMRFEALMPFLWTLKNVNIELFIFLAWFLFNLHWLALKNSMAQIIQHISTTL